MHKLLYDYNTQHLHRTAAAQAEFSHHPRPRLRPRKAVPGVSPDLLG